MKTVLLPLFAAIACAFSIPNIHGTTLVVTTTADSGAGSLRDTLAAASDGDTIQFTAALNGQTITLTSTQLLIVKNLTIDGPGASQLTVKRSAVGGIPHFGIFKVTPSHTVTIQGLTISNGLAPSLGGGIYNDGSTLTIANCVVSGNSAGGGGGIFNDARQTGSADLTINASTLSGNSSQNGGGIYNYGEGELHFAAVVLNDSTISGNSAAESGAGIFNDAYFKGNTFLIIKNTTISGNSASQSGSGGGIYNYGVFQTNNALVSVSNSTISGNSAGTGGGIFNDGDEGKATMGISDSTLSDNSAGQGAGIYNTGFNSQGNGGAEVGISNTILQAGSSGENIHDDPFARVYSFGYNLSSDNGGGFLNVVGDQINTNPMLGPLQDNGGPTLTHGLLMGSPAINAGDPTFTPPPDYDQRGAGFPRVFNGRIDIGAFELQKIAPMPTPASLVNISTRLRVLTGDDALIGGFIVTGNAPKRVIVRAIGPSLTNLGVPGALADPVLEFYGITNDNWRDSQEAEIEATGIAPTNDLESAIVAMVPPGAYTAVVRGNNGGTGVGLVEAYDLDSAADAQLANISTRGFVDSGDNVMIGGFILGNGNMNARVLIRAIGPSLTAFGVPDALADPTLELHNDNGGIIGANDDWRDTQQTEIEATGIPPSDNSESAIVGTLSPGHYTAIVRGKNNTTGVGLVEVYRLGGASTPTPSPTPTANPTATPTATPTSTPAPTPTPTATVPPIPTATPTATPVITPSPTPGSGPAKFGSLSSSAMVGTGDAIVLNAFIVTGPDPKHVIVRGLGPSLGLPAPLADPVIELRASDGTLIRSNDNWRTGGQEAEIIATGIPPTNDLESAIVETLNPGSYTVVLRGVNNGTGNGVGDLHDLSPGTSSTLSAVGTRGNVRTGNEALTSGIVIQQGGGNLLVRVLGPSLPVVDALADPTLELRDSNGALLMANDNWRDDPAQEVLIIPSGLVPFNDAESAIVTSLAPGAYTVIARGRNNTTGIGYVQIYSLPHSGPDLKLTP